MTFVGEIALPRREYLYDLTFCDLLLIERGYNHRSRHQWSIARWQTFYIMSAQIGSKGMNEAGLHHPTDLLRLPWERDHSRDALPTDDEIRELQAEMAAWDEQQNSPQSE